MGIRVASTQVNRLLARKEGRMRSKRLGTPLVLFAAAWVARDGLYAQTMAPIPLAVPGRLGDYECCGGVDANGGEWGRASWSLGAYHGGNTVRVGTCGLSQAAHDGPTSLRLVDALSGELLAADSDASCGANGAMIVYTLSRARSLKVQAACQGPVMPGFWVCNGTVAYGIRLDSHAQWDGGWSFPNSAAQSFSNSGVIPSDYDPDIFGERPHFQGVQRLRSSSGALTNDYVLSGDHEASLSIFDADHALHHQPLFSSSFPGEGHTSLTHLGGMQSIGKYLFAPVEGEPCVGRPSEVLVFDMTAPASPVFKYRIPRAAGSGNDCASAVGVTKLAGGFGKLGGGFLMAVAGHDSRLLDFYVKYPNPDGWANIQSSSWSKVETGFEPPVSDWPAYQNINLFIGNTKWIYLVGTHRTGEYTPWPSDWADLYRFTLSDDTPPQVQGFEKVDNYEFDGSGSNFSGAAGLYLNNDGKMRLVSTDKRLHDTHPSRTFFRTWWPH